MPTHILSPSLPPLPFLSCYKAATLPHLYTYTFNYNNNDIVLYFQCINTSFTHYINTLLCQLFLSHRLNPGPLHFMHDIKTSIYLSIICRVRAYRTCHLDIYTIVTDSLRRSHTHEASDIYACQVAIHDLGYEIFG